MTALQQNIAKLEHHLARFAKTGIRNRIGGEDRPGSGGTFQTISPVDKTVICDVARSTAAPRVSPAPNAVSRSVLCG